MRELRNNTTELLRRVDAGEEIVITRRGKPIAKLTPTTPRRRRPIPRDEMARRLSERPADPEFKELLKEIAGETTDDIPVR